MVLSLAHVFVGLLKPSRAQTEITHFVQRPPSSRKIEEIDKQVIKMIAKGHHALRMVEEPEFRELIRMVSHCPNYELLSRKKLSESLLSKIYNEYTEKIKIKLNKAQAVCVTTDAWTSRNNESYIALMAHYIDDNSKLCSSTLGCIQYTERHTSENLCTFLKETMNHWQISHKIVAVVSDNAPNIISAIRMGNWRSIGCFAHLINLVVQRATEQISDTLVKVKSIVEYFKRSSQGLHKLQESQRQMNLPLLKLKQDVPTRWNWTYEMLDRVVTIKDAVITTIALTRNDLSLQQEDWSIIEEVLPLLLPFYEVTTEISAEKNVTLSKVIVMYKMIERILAKSSANHSKVQAVLEVLKKEMNARFQNIENNILFAECTVLDPRFKKRGFKNADCFEKAVQGLRNKVGSGQIPHKNEANDSFDGNGPPSAPPTSTKSIWEEYDETAGLKIKK
ncbi:unnamed protein product [Acanthoscelides obtectus]|uniref:Uncharacterized protein n=1 Tax=Acanthoscelides obtectus TaxID=200917 RepID=A0A9P0KN34_ACAOB|nr:unnamed protein product [Acanthoscelides obtectus]CAK1655105.1 Zinc finger BED domain-containing protein 1 [Acanthoscelides obtectus]